MIVLNKGRNQNKNQKYMVLSQDSFQTKPVRTAKQIRKSGLKRRLIKFSIVMLVLFAAVFYTLYQVNKFFDANRIIVQSPVQIQTPIKIEDRKIDEPKQAEPIKEVKANPVPVAAVRKETVASNLTAEQIADKIWLLESGRTNSKGCISEGRFNGYGYAPGTCYPSHDAVQRLVIKWIEQRRAMPLGEMLCGYNQGFTAALTDCPYYQKFLKSVRYNY